MSQSNYIQLQGVLTGGPASPSYYSSTLAELLPLNFCDVYASETHGIITVNSTDLAPFVLPFQGITKGRLMAFRILAGLTMKILMTTALGVNAVPCSDLFLLRARNPDDEVTAISLVTGAQAVDVAYMLAGDQS